MRNLSKSPVFRGTLILTFSGMFVRVLGFFYKIFLSKLLGSYYLGIYQLVFPVYGICFTIYGSGIQTALSSLVAQAVDLSGARAVLRRGILLSLSAALCLSILLFSFSENIAGRILLEPDCASPLRCLSLAFPACALGSCICGYYYGLKKSLIPACSQIVEQVIRILCVLVISLGFGIRNPSICCTLAVFGIVTGEFGAAVYSFLSLKHMYFKNKESFGKTSKKRPAISPKHPARGFLPILRLSLPLTSTRLFISLLHSAEAILIPYALRCHGLSQEDAIRLFGILTGMALPVILFPSSIPNSVCVLLLPSISNAQKNEQDYYISRQCRNAVNYSLIIGLSCTLCFLLTGKIFGNLFFHEALAGEFICRFSFLCPFLYLSTTLGSILNGLGKTSVTFVHTMLGLLLQLATIFLLIPEYGIRIYPVSLFLCQMLISLLHLHSLKKTVSFQIRPYAFLRETILNLTKKW